MTKTMSKEWGRYKVCVNCVAFGFIETRLTKPLDDPESKIVIEGKEVQAGVPQAALSALPTMVPLGRAGTAEEAAGGVYLFCIPESNYVSGQTLRSEEHTSELQSIMSNSYSVFFLNTHNKPTHNE